MSSLFLDFPAAASQSVRWDRDIIPLREPISEEGTAAGQLSIIIAWNIPAAGLPDPAGNHRTRSPGRVILSFQISKIVSGILTLFFLCLLAAPAEAQGEVTISFFLPQTELDLGERVRTELQIFNASRVVSAQIIVEYTPDFLAVGDANPQLTGVQIEGGTFWNAGGPVVKTNAVDDIFGEIIYAVDVAQPVSGSGVAVTIDLTGKAAGQGYIRTLLVELQLEDGRYLYPQAIEVPLVITSNVAPGQTQPAATATSNGSSETPTPGPGTLEPIASPGPGTPAAGTLRPTLPPGVTPSETLPPGGDQPPPGFIPPTITLSSIGTAAPQATPTLPIIGIASLSPPPGQAGGAPPAAGGGPSVGLITFDVTRAGQPIAAAPAGMPAVGSSQPAAAAPARPAAAPRWPLFLAFGVAFLLFLSGGGLLVWRILWASYGTIDGVPVSGKKMNPD